MNPSRLLALGAATLVLLLLAAVPASAWHRRHAPFRPTPDPQSCAYGPGYYPAGGWQADVIAHATARMQAAPGVTNELSPDAKETATGGPSGGVPEFSDN